jgi:predicted GIY-YIG superfamily endonuclease
MPPQKYYVYILECKDKNDKTTLYVGYTSKTPEKRLQEHLTSVKTQNKKHYTGRQKSIKLVYSEVYDNMFTAKKREREIKKLGSKYKRKLIINLNHSNSYKPLY